jgi:hypothetical protein
VSSPAPGWYPDPAQSGGTRWWDGQAWTEQVAAPPAPPAWGQQPHGGQQWAPAGQPGGATAPAAPQSWLKRNTLSLATVGVVVLYLLLLAFAHIAVLGILPIVLAVRALRGKEPMAIPATVVAGLAFVLALYEFTGR